eukprot:TRINITY_DN8858_c0_g1_i1.p1 TRINITY_DN8858_c0_g1~~TRINITY_DN8858_c0_g1_i1.p1  ORF type:complete len:1115 (+),score=249.69 TRINITY_DN8858_c0_g1_i1:41-3346(+)
MAENSEVILDETEVIMEDTEYLEDETEYLVEDDEIGAEAEDESVDASISSLQEVQDKTFDQVRLPEDVLAEVGQAWKTFISSASSREAAGQAIFSAIFDSAPSLQNLFKTPIAIMAMRLMNALNSIISSAGNPKELKVQVEMLGFQHLDIDVTVPRVTIFRDAITDLFDMELGERFNSKAKLGFRALLNYVGGAFIFIRREYAGRIKIIGSSWRTANNKAKEMMGVEEEEGGGEGGEAVEEETDIKAEAAEAKTSGDKDPRSSGEEARTSGEAKNLSNTKVPTTFNEMFLFNGAVMDFGNATWMQLVLEQFDAIVTNVANSYRLQEECDVLSLVLAKYKGEINLPEFKAVMLSSLRSLVPKDWDTNHEVAWNWLWENVERMLKNLMGKPALMEKALARMMMSMTEDDMNFFRREVYKTFFTLAPAGQDFFKQSTTRLYWIADKWFAMTIEIFREPKQMVEDISALGLRHVGYAVPTEFFAPFVSAGVEVVRQMITDDEAADAFRWSLTLISKVLVRTVLEGSTIVMKAINTNQANALVKAISVAPRGKRSMELLNITVGTQSISPFYWSLESGSLNCSRAMIVDLLTIRADRDNYYYGCDDLFTRHPDVINRLCLEAPSLLWPLLDGLIWRSRVAFMGQRRVNYYVKHLIQDSEGKLNKALEWFAENKDPKIITHSSAVIVSDIVWAQVAAPFFLLGRIYSLFILLVFIFSQSIIYQLREGPESFEERIAIFACRLIIYLGSMCKVCFAQGKLLAADISQKNFVRVWGIPFPAYLKNVQEVGNLCLFIVLVVMGTREPVFQCSGNTDVWKTMEETLFTESCDAAQNIRPVYSVCSALAMMLYFLLLTDFTIFSMRMSAFLLVCGRVVSEIGLFALALGFLILAFSCGISSLDQEMPSFDGIDKAALTLLQMAFSLYPTSQYPELHAEVWAIIAVAVFLMLVVIFLLNLLIAQLNQAYQTIFADMQGYARLNRAAVTVKTLEQVSEKRWMKFLSGLKLDDRLEFNEGDVGVSGGLQVLEASNLNPTTVDAIRRFGGSTSPTMPWPAEDGVENGDDDRFDRLEKLIVRATKGGGKAKRKGAGSSRGGGSSGVSGGSDDQEGSE